MEHLEFRNNAVQCNPMHVNCSQSIYQVSGTPPEQEASTFKFSALKEFSVLGGDVSLPYKTGYVVAYIFCDFREEKIFHEVNGNGMIVFFLKLFIEIQFIYR